MDNVKIQAIRSIVDSGIKNFVEGFELRYTSEVDDLNGVINAKKNNVFMAELGEEFMFYSAFVRSFDSSFGKVLENLGNAIAKITYEVRGNLKSYLLPQQTQHIDYLMTAYEKHDSIPNVDDYQNFVCHIPRNTESYQAMHATDNYFYNREKGEHILIELKAGGDLDNKKSKAEKISLLNEYFILKNSLQNDEKVKIYLATAYNKYGEGNEWKQERVKQYFVEEELLIGQDYWNFVCDDDDGFKIIIEQYKISSEYIKQALLRIKSLYF